MKKPKVQISVTAMIPKDAHEEVISLQNVSLTVSDLSGVAVIDTTKNHDGNRTFSNIRIKKIKNGGRERYLITADYQPIYSAAQMCDFICKKQKVSKDMSLSKICSFFNINEDDYVIRYDWSQIGSERETIRFKKQKIILSKKFHISLDCPNYVIIY